MKEVEKIYMNALEAQEVAKSDTMPSDSTDDKLRERAERELCWGESIECVEFTVRYEDGTERTLSFER